VFIPAQAETQECFRHSGASPHRLFLRRQESREVQFLPNKGVPLADLKSPVLAFVRPPFNLHPIHPCSWRSLVQPLEKVV